MGLVGQHVSSVVTDGGHAIECGLVTQCLCQSPTFVAMLFWPLVGVVLFLQVQDLIKGASQLSGWNLDSHTRGMAALRAYTSSGECRCSSCQHYSQHFTLLHVLPPWHHNKNNKAV